MGSLTNTSRNAIALSFNKPTIATHLKLNRDRLFSSDTINVQSDRPLIPQTNDRNSPQIKQRSPISSDTLNVQQDRPLVPQISDLISPQVKQRSPISSDILNVQQDRHLIPQTSDLISKQTTIAYFHQKH